LGPIKGPLLASILSVPSTPFLALAKSETKSLGNPTPHKSSLDQLFCRSSSILEIKYGPFALGLNFDEGQHRALDLYNVG
jgi:hypothetical protein